MKTYSLPRTIWRVLYPVLIFIVLSVAIAFIAGVLIGIIFVAGEAASGGFDFDQTALADEMVQLLAKHALTLQLLTTLAGLAVFLPMWLSSRKRSPVYKNERPALNVLLSAGLFVGVNLLLIAIMSAVDIMRYFPSYEDVSEFLTGGSFIMQVLALGIAAPVVEELCFRGILINRMRAFPLWTAAVVQGVLFGIAHFNLLQGIYAFLLGLLLGWLYIRFRSIILVIAAHMAFNSASVFLNAFNAEINILFILIPALIITALCGYFLLKQPKAQLVFDPMSAAEPTGDEPGEPVEIIDTP